MSLTCDYCLQGKAWRCKGPGCARYDRERAQYRNSLPTAKKPKTIKKSPGPPRVRDQSHGGQRYNRRVIPSHMLRAIEDSLLEDIMGHSEIARRAGVPRGYVKGRAKVIKRYFALLEEPRQDVSQMHE